VVFLLAMTLAGMFHDLVTLTCLDPNHRRDLAPLCWARGAPVFFLSLPPVFAVLGFLSFRRTRVWALQWTPHVCACVWVANALGSCATAAILLADQREDVQCDVFDVVRSFEFRPLQRAIALAVGIGLTTVGIAHDSEPLWLPFAVSVAARSVASLLMQSALLWYSAHVLHDTDQGLYAGEMVLSVFCIPAFAGLTAVLLRPLWFIRKAARGTRPFVSDAVLRALVALTVMGTLTVYVAGLLLAFDVPNSVGTLLVLLTVLLIRVTAASQMSRTAAVFQEAVSEDVAGALVLRAFAAPAPGAPKRSRLDTEGGQLPGNEAVRSLVAPGLAMAKAVHGSLTGPESADAGQLDTVGELQKQTSKSLTGAQWRTRLLGRPREHGQGRGVVSSPSIATDIGGLTRRFASGSWGARARTGSSPTATTGIRHRLHTTVSEDIPGPPWAGAVQVSPPPLPYLRVQADVTVVFSDIVGYTQMSSELPPDAVMLMLHEFFTKLDALLDHTGAFKYSTVGDGYIVVTGYPHPDPDHALHALRTAQAMVHIAASVQTPAPRGEEAPSPNPKDADVLRLEAQDLAGAGAMLEVSSMGAGGSPRPTPGAVAGGDGPSPAQSPGTLQIRVGVHSGTVAASTLGVKRNTLTLIGDTLNTASRMETLSRAGHVRITQTTLDLLPEAVRGSFVREELQVKGKGAMVTYVADAVAAPPF